MKQHTTTKISTTQGYISTPEDQKKKMLKTTKKKTAKTQGKEPNYRISRSGKKKLSP